MASPTKLTNLERAFVTYATRMKTAADKASFDTLKAQIKRIVDTAKTVLEVINDRSQYQQTKLDQAEKLLKEIDDGDPDLEEPSFLDKITERRTKAVKKQKELQATEKTRKAYEKFVAKMKGVISLTLDQKKDIKILKESVLGDQAIKIDFITGCLKGYKHQHMRLSKDKKYTSETKTDLSSKLGRIITWVNSFEGNLAELHFVKKTTDEELWNAEGQHLNGFKKWEKEITKLRSTLDNIKKEATELHTEVTSAKIVAAAASIAPTLVAAPTIAALPASTSAATPEATNPPDKLDLQREVEILELRVALFIEKARKEVLTNKSVSTDANMSPTHQQLEKLTKELEEKRRLLAADMGRKLSLAPEEDDWTIGLNAPDPTTSSAASVGEAANHPSVTAALATGDPDLVKAILDSLRPPEQAESPGDEFSRVSL